MQQTMTDDRQLNTDYAAASRPSVEDMLRREAAFLGFSHCGIARAGGTSQLRERLETWIDAGYHADMRWIARDTGRRADPSIVLDGAESVVMLACNYYTPVRFPSEPARGIVSRYALGDDYHDVLMPRVKRLAGLLEECGPGSRTLACIDTGPVMEKAWAERAGIGWIGKNGCLITRDFGSWLFLASIITNVPLEPDSPSVNMCGSCRRCVDACPTHAIAANGLVDARRCISYLTIECKADEIPGVDELDLANRLFGCDICQDVCPWNRFARDTTEAAFRPRPQALAPDLNDIAELSDEDFELRFAGSPVMRARTKGLRRNARILLRQQESHVE
jgi:epoxyqueuosine reductase